MSNKPTMPVDDPRSTISNKRGKVFAPLKSSWGQQGDPGRSVYTPGLSTSVLSEALGDYYGTGNSAAPKTK